MGATAAQDPRWHLYRLLADPVRLRLLALGSEHELSVGELATALDQTQPNVSRHTSPLRQAGLLVDRRDGTRTLIRLSAEAARDPVIADALAEGRRLVAEDGTLGRVEAIVRERDARTREFFATRPSSSEHGDGAGELVAYLYALGALVERRGLAVDAGTGDGAVLDVLAPFFERVIAVDRSEAQIEGARRRARLHGHENVELVRGEIGGPEARRAVGAGADVVVAGRMLHHAAVPRSAVAALASLLAPGGRLLVVDYAPHGDESLREEQADVWMGFDAAELQDFAEGAGLVGSRVVGVPPGCWLAPSGAPARRASGRRVPWLALVATRPESKTTPPSRARSRRSASSAKREW